LHLTFIIICLTLNANVQLKFSKLCVEGVSVQLPIFVLDKVSFSTSLAVFFETSHLIEQIVDMNRSTNCSRRPIFKAADEFLHHRTCLLKEKAASNKILDIFQLDVRCMKHSAVYIVQYTPAACSGAYTIRL